MPTYRRSRYQFAPLHMDSDGNMFIDVPDPIVKPRRGDKITRVGTGDTFHTLAWLEYKIMKSDLDEIRPSGFWWAVAQVNNIVDATEPIEDGTILRVPSVRRLNQEILKRPKPTPTRSRVY